MAGRNYPQPVDVAGAMEARQSSAWVEVPARALPLPLETQGMAG